MKKIITQLLFFVFGSATLSAQEQLPNNSFENWEDVDIKDSLNNWITLLGTFYPSTPNVMKIEEGVVGNAVFLQTVESFEGEPAAGAVVLATSIGEDVPEGYPYASEVDELNAYLRYDIEPTDTGMVLVLLENDGVIYSFNSFPVYGTQTTWNLFTWDLGDPILTPDKVTIAFFSSGYNDTEPVAESWMEVDSVYFTNAGPEPDPLPNFNFEDWTTVSIETCTNWNSFDPVVASVFGFQNITQSADAFEGDYSLRMEVFATNVEEDVYPYISNGMYNFETEELEGGSAFTSEPILFKGHYKLLSDGVDSAKVYLRFWNTEGSIAEFADTVLLPTEEWAEFNIPIDLGFTPDSVLTFILGGQQEGAVTYLDNVRFVYDDVSIPEIAHLNLNTYPNPANQIFSLEVDQTANVTITDMLGQTVYTENEIKQFTLVKTADWPNGTYLIQVQYADQFKTERIIVQH